MRKHTLLRRTWNKDQPATGVPGSGHSQDSEVGDRKDASIPVSYKQPSLTQESRVSTSASINSSFYSSSTDMRTPASSCSSASQSRDSAHNKSRSRISVTSVTTVTSVTSVLPCSSRNSEASLPLYVTSVATSTTSPEACNGGDNTNAVVSVMSNPNDLIVRTEGQGQPAERTSFYLKRNEDVHITPEHCRIIKYMLSNIRAGSIYGKPYGEPPVVIPRYSALPRSSSMEVNPSSPSPDATDRESDSASLVDSLDDPSSPRQSACRSHSHEATLARRTHDDKPVRGDLSALLPDNSGIPDCDSRSHVNKSRGSLHSRPKLQKAAAFFIPMLSEGSIDKDVKPVAERMPDKVRDRLNKRKQRIDQKCHLKPTDLSNYEDSNGNRMTGNQIKSRNENNNVVTKKTFKVEKKNNKALSMKVNNSADLNCNAISIRKPKRTNKHAKRKYVTSEISENSDTSSRSSSVSNVLRTGFVSTTVGNTSSVAIQRVGALSAEQHDRGEDHKVEILEITEEISSGQVFHHSPRSRIPVPVQSSPRALDHAPVGTRQHAAYSFTRDEDPKTDQLIANLLIDSLNNIDRSVDVVPPTIRDLPKRTPHVVSSQHGSSNWYRQKFEMIPEEKTSMSQGSSNEELSKPSNVNNVLTKSVEVETQVESRELQDEQPTRSGKRTASRTSDRSLIDASSQTDAASIAAPADIGIVPAIDVPVPMPATTQPVSKGKAALGKSRDDDSASSNAEPDSTTIPKGWITFYMLRKTPDSPNSSTDEGTHILHDHLNNYK